MGAGPSRPHLFLARVMGFLEALSLISETGDFDFLAGVADFLEVLSVFPEVGLRFRRAPISKGSDFGERQISKAL